MIQRRSVVGRHDIHLTSSRRDTPLSVGNGEFAFTVDVTGLQTFADDYERDAGRRDGVPVMPLGTQSQWCYHWAPNPQGWRLEDTFEEYAGPHGPIRYPTAYDYREDREQSAAAGRAAGYYFWANPQRVHLARIALRAGEGEPPLRRDEVTSIAQRLDLWTGTIHSRFRLRGEEVSVRTAVHPERDAVAVAAVSPLFASGRLGIEVAFPHIEESFEAPPVWDRPQDHRTIVTRRAGNIDIAREIDGTRYAVRLNGGESLVTEPAPHTLRIDGNGRAGIDLITEFSPVPSEDAALESAEDVFLASARRWRVFWESGAAIDLSGSEDPRARELERRIVLSQYQTAVHSSGSTPPQETGLVCNSWGGTFHLEMHWWHAAHFAAWGRPALLERSMDWYRSILPVARETARNQGFRGARWPKHVGPEGIESPNEIGPLLVWQQPHPIHFAELLYLSADEPARILGDYAELVDETAEFIASFVWREGKEWHLPPPLMPAQEIYGAEKTWDPLFEVSSFRWALRTAQRWRERRGVAAEPLWDEIADGLMVTPTAVGAEHWYDAVQRPARTEFTDHPSFAGALGVVPDTGMIDHETMWHTLQRAIARWNWPNAWGWDFPMLSMCAVRTGHTADAIDLLLRDEQKNTYLPNGHNMQVPTRLPLYLPGNGGLLMAAALLFGGWADPDGTAHVPELPEGWKAETEGFPPRP